MERLSDRLRYLAGLIERTTDIKGDDIREAARVLEQQQEEVYALQDRINRMTASHRPSPGVTD